MLICWRSKIIIIFCNILSLLTKFMNFSKNEMNLKRSFINETYHNQQNNTLQGGILKRTQFALTHDFSSGSLNVQHPKSPKLSATLPGAISSFQNQQFLNPQFNHQPVYQQSQHIQSYAQSLQFPSQYHISSSIGGHQNFQEPTLTRNEHHSSLQQLKPVSYSSVSTKSQQWMLQEQIKALSFKLQKIQEKVQLQDLSFDKKFKELTITSLKNGTAQQLRNLIKQQLLEDNKTTQIQDINLKMSNSIKCVQDIKKQVNQKFVFIDSVFQGFNKIMQNLAQNTKKNMQSVNKNMRQSHADVFELRNKMQSQIKQFQEQSLSIINNLETNQRKQKRQSEQVKLGQNEHTISHMNQLVPSLKCFLGNPILLKIVSKMSICLKPKLQDQIKYQSVEEEEIIYKVDGQGFLLDGSGYYLVNSKEQRVKLNSRQINLICSLRQNN